MFDLDGYKKNLTAYGDELATRRDREIKYTGYTEAARLDGIRLGVVAALNRAKGYEKPDPEPVKPPGDIVLDEFVDWLNAWIALTGFIALPGTPAQHELKALHKVRDRLAELAKKYPAE